MDEQQVRQIVKTMMIESQYNLGGVVYHAHTGLDSPHVLYRNIENSPGYWCSVTATTGTTAVHIFGAKEGQFNAVITGMFLISNDTTAGNITLTNNGNTVATIAKGTSAGVLVGATSVANVNYSIPNSLTVVSSSVGNATVFVTFTS